jgi:hypothetical protein
MAVNITSNVESKFYIGTSTAAATAADYAADTYKEVGGLIDLGEFSDEAAVNTIRVISERRVRKSIGARDGGTQEVTCAYDKADVGQKAVIAASAGDVPFNFKVGIGDGSIFYYRALVTKVGMPLKTADDAVQRTFSLAIDSAIVEPVA